MTQRSDARESRMWLIRILNDCWIKVNQDSAGAKSVCDFICFHSLWGSRGNAAEDTFAAFRLFKVYLENKLSDLKNDISMQKSIIS